MKQCKSDKTITINSQDILRYLKQSCQFSQIIEGVVTYKIIQAYILEKGIAAKPEELQQAADNFRLDQQLYTIEDTYAWLKEHHLSLDEFENLISTNIFAQKLMEYLFSDCVEAFFLEHYLDYTSVAMYEVILDDDALANKLFCVLQQGAISFQEVACRYITQPSLRHAGGYCGLMRHRDLKPEISNAVFAADPPQLLKPIITSKGVHLIKVEAIVQPKLDEQLRTQILSELFSRWLKKQIQEIKVEIEFG